MKKINTKAVKTTGDGIPGWNWWKFRWNFLIYFFFKYYPTEYLIKN
jgi:hypothetical protein